jgi:hypothetical protein
MSVLRTCVNTSLSALLHPTLMHEGFAANLNKLVLFDVLVPLLAVGMQYYNVVSRAGVQDTVALALLSMYVICTQEEA